MNFFVLCITFVFMGKSAGASSAGRYDISLSEAGIAAKKIYQTLDVPEQIDRVASDGTTYKVGKNILCIKTKKITSGGQSKATFFCSSGFNAQGESESSEAAN